MPKRILVIDDDPDLLEILNIIFEDEGFEVRLSETGEEAENIQQILPDLILMDIRLSGSDKNGADMCYKIKSRFETRNMPILMLSAEDDIEEISLKCGANGYISKPFEIAHLLIKVREHLVA